MVDKTIQNICNVFSIENKVTKVSVFNSGHINDTYLIETKADSSYVLQRINHHVFKDVESLMANKVCISNHLKSQQLLYEVIDFIATKQGHYYHIDDNGNYWNMMRYISNSKTEAKATHTKMVFEAGKLYGDFINRTQTITVASIKETLANFHHMPFRFSQYNEALKNATNAYKTKAKEVLEFVLNCKSEMHELSTLKANNRFPIRITHNDAKLSNILFNKNNEGLAVIDLDTVMPGIVHFDFGDSVRSICSTTEEDDDNYSKTTINLDYYKAFCEGYAQSLKTILTSTEIAFLPLGAKTITFIMGLRFLTDYLNGSTYYKIKFPDHNLVRAKNQFALVKDIQANYELMQSITQDSFAK